MNLNSLFSRAHSPSLEIRNQSREQFFSIKRNSKRLKISNILTEPAQKGEENDEDKVENDNKNDDYSINIKESKQELASTISSDHHLTFRFKQPKRKKNRNPKNSNDPNCQQQSASENQAPPTCPTQNVSTVINKPFIIETTYKNRFSEDSFVIISKIGQGTYSKVFRAIQKETGFICSLKVLSKQTIKMLKVQQNIFREIKIQFFLNHPHITKLYGFFDDQKYIYLICEYATDENLYQHLNKNKAEAKLGLPIEKVSLFVGQICSAISYMHRNYIIHRDIKPENMILTFNETIKLCDFGWSIFNPEKEMRSTLCGTPLYLAPELINSDNYNQSVDVWALGVLTYQLLTAQIPFKIRSIRDLRKVLSSEINFTKMKCKEAVQFIENALKKNHEQRHNIFELFHHPFLKYFHQQTKP